jgi:hypothetical protein
LFNLRATVRLPADGKAVNNEASQKTCQIIFSNDTFGGKAYVLIVKVHTGSTFQLHTFPSTGKEIFFYYGII